MFQAAGRGDHRTVDIDRRVGQKCFVLLPPHVDARLVQRFHQQEDVPAIEASTEIAGRRRIGNPLCAERVEIHLVVAPQFEMLQPRAAGQDVVSDVEHVVRFVIRQVKLEQVNSAVDPLSELHLLHHALHESHPAGRNAACALGDLVMNVRAPQHRPVADRGIALVL